MRAITGQIRCRGDRRPATITAVTRTELRPERTWLLYRGVWGFVGTLSWTTAVVYFIRDVGMSPLELVLAGTALELAYFLFEVPTGIVADLYSRKLSVIVAALVSGLAMLTIGAAPETPVALALVDLRLPFLAAGGTTVVLAFLLMATMPERNFTRPQHHDITKPFSAITTTARHGAGLIKASPVLLLILGIFVFLGAFEEGFDRLWEAHLLLDVGLPDIGPLGDVAWFGILGAATLIVSFAVAAPLVKRVEQLQTERLAKLLLGLHGVMMMCALGFALAGSLLLAVTAYLTTSVVRDLAAPPTQTWLNGTITDSSVRATVLSFTSIAGSFGEWSGGPALGAIGNRWGVRTALATGALLLTPALLLFARAVRHHGVEPELAEADAGEV